MAATKSKSNKTPKCPVCSGSMFKNGACVLCANADEIGRFNAAVEGKTLLVNAPGSMSHGQKVCTMSLDFILQTVRPNGPAWETSSWYYANDGRWAQLLEQAGVARNPLNADVKAPAAPEAPGATIARLQAELAAAKADVATLERHNAQRHNEQGVAALEIDRLTAENKALKAKIVTIANAIHG